MGLTHSIKQWSTAHALVVATMLAGAAQAQDGGVALIDQIGAIDSTAVIEQNAAHGSEARIVQRGESNLARIIDNSVRNFARIAQFGQDNEASIILNGADNRGEIVQNGDRNDAALTVNANALDVQLIQDGNDLSHEMTVSSGYSGRQITIRQSSLNR